MTAIADRLLAIDTLRDEAEANDDGTDFDALEDEYEALQEEHEELTTGYGPEQLAKAGVIAHWRYDGPQVIYGLIRPEDMAPAEGEATPSGSAGAGGAAPGTEGPEGDGNEGTAPLEVAASLAADLRTERAIVIGAGLAADPALAQDLALFKFFFDLWPAQGTRVSWSMGITATRGERPHGKPDGMDQGPTQVVAALRHGLDLTWMDDARSVAERFERFRLLDADMKARIVAVAMAEAIAPADLAHGETLLCHVAHQVVPDMRAAWRPTGEAFFGADQEGAAPASAGHRPEAARGSRPAGDGEEGSTSWTTSTGSSPRPSPRSRPSSARRRSRGARRAWRSPSHASATASRTRRMRASPIRTRRSTPTKSSTRTRRSTWATRTSRGRSRRPSPPDDPR